MKNLDFPKNKSVFAKNRFPEGETNETFLDACLSGYEKGIVIPVLGHLLDHVWRWCFGTTFEWSEDGASRDNPGDSLIVRLRKLVYLDQNTALTGGEITKPKLPFLNQITNRDPPGSRARPPPPPPPGGAPRGSTTSWFKSQTVASTASRSAKRPTTSASSTRITAKRPTTAASTVKRTTTASSSRPTTKRPIAFKSRQRGPFECYSERF